MLDQKNICEYVEDINWWNYNIDQICNRLEAGWDMPPLIAENRNGNFRLNDGNHRLGALQKLKRRKYYLIIWDDYSHENIINQLKNCGINLKYKHDFNVYSRSTNSV